MGKSFHDLCNRSRSFHVKWQWYKLDVCVSLAFHWLGQNKTKSSPSAWNHLTWRQCLADCNVRFLTELGISASATLLPWHFFHSLLIVSICIWSDLTDSQSIFTSSAWFSEACVLSCRKHIAPEFKFLSLCITKRYGTHCVSALLLDLQRQHITLSHNKLFIYICVIGECDLKC